MTSSLECARQLAALGLSVIPVPAPRPGARVGEPGDGKVPTIPWRAYQTRLPTEDEQVDYFRRVGDAFPDRMVVIRSYDLGGDKFPAAFRWDDFRYPSAVE